MDGSIIMDFLQNIAVPALAAVVGWFAKTWRSKQKKEADILTNVTQILEMQRSYIAEQDKDKREEREVRNRLEEKLDMKEESILQANRCKHANDDGGCPVLIHEQATDDSKCASCKYFQKEAAAI